MQIKINMPRRLVFWCFVACISTSILGVSFYVKRRAEFNSGYVFPNLVHDPNSKWLAYSMNSTFYLSPSQLNAHLQDAKNGDCDAIKELSLYYGLYLSNTKEEKYWLRFGANMDCVYLQYEEILRSNMEKDIAATKYWIDKFENNATSSSISDAAKQAIIKIRNNSNQN